MIKGDELPPHITHELDQKPGYTIQGQEQHHILTAKPHHAHTIPPQLRLKIEPRVQQPLEQRNLNLTPPQTHQGRQPPVHHPSLLQQQQQQQQQQLVQLQQQEERDRNTQVHNSVEDILRILHCPVNELEEIIQSVCDNHVKIFGDFSEIKSRIHSLEASYLVRSAIL